MRVILVGWENFTDREGRPIPFNAEMLDAVLSNQDLSELELRLLHEMAMGELDKKKFALSAQSNSAGSAPSAAAGSAVRPARPSPLKSNASPAGEPEEADALPAGAREATD